MYSAMGKTTESLPGFEVMRCGSCGGTHVQLLAKRGSSSESYTEIRIVCDGCKSHTLLMSPPPRIDAIAIDTSPGTHTVY